MSRNEHDRLRDIKDAIVAIHEHLAGAGEERAGQEAALLHDALLFPGAVDPSSGVEIGNGRA